MKILRVIRSVNPAGGGPIEGIRQITPLLAAEGVVTEVASLDAPGDPASRAFPGVLHALGPGRGSYGYAAGWTSWLKARREAYDAVIVHGLWQYHSFGAWRALAGGNAPYYVYPHGMLDPWFKRQYPLKHLKKWLYWPWAEYRVLRDAASVFFTSAEEMAMAAQSFWLHRWNGRVVSYGTGGPPEDAETQKAAFFNEHGHLRGKRLVLFLGRLHEKKGCDLLIQSFAKWSNANPPNTTREVHLIMAGPDQSGWKAQLHAMAVAAGVAERVSWPGMLQGRVKWGAFRAAEVFVLPSHQENFGIAAAEALACGTPVLVSNKVNIWREIEEDGAGLVAADTAAGTDELLQRWFGLAPSARAKMRENARACFDRRFEIGQAARELSQLLRSSSPGLSQGKLCAASR